MPSMFRDKSGKYRVQWVHDGRRRSRTFDTPKEAKLFEMKLEMGEIDIAQASSPTLKDFAKVWMRDYCQVEKAESQWQEDRSVLDQHILPALGGEAADRASQGGPGFAQGGTESQGVEAGQASLTEDGQQHPGTG